MIGISLASQYQINSRLYNEYKKFRIDTAIGYALQNQDIGKQLNDQALIAAAHIELDNLYSSSGKFLESEVVLIKMDVRCLKAFQALKLPVQPTVAMPN